MSPARSPMEPTPKASAILEKPAAEVRLPPDAIHAERDRMQIDPPITCGSGLYSSRPLIWLHGIPKPLQRGQRGDLVATVERQIHITMGTRPAAEQHVHAPPAGNPEPYLSRA